MNKAFLVGHRFMGEALSIGAFEIERNSQIGDFARRELRDHRPHRLDPAAPGKFGRSCAKRPRGKAQTLMRAIAEIGLNADGLAVDEIHGGEP